MTPEQIQELRRQYNYNPADLKLSDQGRAGEVVNKRLQNILGETTTTATPSFKDRLTEITGRQSEKIQESARLVKEGKQGILPAVGQTIAGGVKAAGEAVALPLTMAAEKAFQFVGEYAPENIKQAATELVQKGIELSKPSLDAYAALPAEQRANIRGLTDLVGGGLDLALVGGAVKPIATGAIKTAEATAAGAQQARSITDKLINKVITPKSPTTALGQIAQGTTEDVKALAQTLAKVDTSKVKTFQDLLQNVDEAIPAIAKQVDDELLKDAGVYKLDQLALSQTTKAGKEIKTDFVTKALDNLSELYKTTGDNVAKADIDDVISKAKAVGLTRKEVNDISRLYGQEFGSKAFSKLGEPLTSVNAQAYENVRSGLKEVARQGIGGAEAKALDQQLSSIFDAKTLIQKNVEAVNKIKQKIQERGLLEKIGNATAKVIDTLSGGTIRGFVGGLLPRGAGYKVMNALDIEEALRKNLNIIEKALKTQSDEEFVKLLNNSYSKELKSRAASSLTKPTTPTTKNSINNISNIDNTIPQKTSVASKVGENFAIVPPIPTPDENGNIEITPESFILGMLGSVGLSKAKAAKINKSFKAEDRRIMKDLIDYNAGGYKPDAKALKTLETEASFLADKISSVSGLKLPKTVDGLSTMFAKFLNKINK